MTELQIDYLVQTYDHFRFFAIVFAIVFGVVHFGMIIAYIFEFVESGELKLPFWYGVAGLIATVVMFVVMPEVDLFRRLLETL